MNILYIIRLLSIYELQLMNLHTCQSTTFLETVYIIVLQVLLKYQIISTKVRLVNLSSLTPAVCGTNPDVIKRKLQQFKRW